MTESTARAALFELQSSMSPSYTWMVSQKPVYVRIPFPVIDRLENEAVESFKSLSSRGSEIGGLLFGRVTPGQPAEVTIEDYELISCDYSRGPLYRLGDADMARFDRSIQQHASSSLTVVGMFRSNTRKGLSLDTDDVAFFDARFRDPHHIVLLIRPFATKASSAGIFIRENGSVQGETCYLEFPFRSSLLSSEKPVVEHVESKQAAPPASTAAPAPAAPKPTARGQIVPIASRREMTPISMEHSVPVKLADPVSEPTARVATPAVSDPAPSVPPTPAAETVASQTQAPPTVTAQTIAPQAEAPQAAAPPAAAPPAAAPQASAPPAAAPPAAAPPAAVPQTAAPQAAAPQTAAPQAAAPQAAAPQTAAPQAAAPQAAAPQTAAPQAAAPQAAAPQVDNKLVRPRLEDRLGRPSSDEKISRPKLEDKPLRPPSEEKISRPKLEDKPVRPAPDEKISRPKPEDRLAKPVVEDKVATPKPEEKTFKPPVEEKIAKPAAKSQVEEPIAPAKVALSKLSAPFAAATEAAEIEPEQKRGKMLWIGLAVGVGAVLLLILALAYPPFLHRNRPSGPAQDSSQLSLRVERTAGEILLTWNRDSDAIRTATHAVLSIQDGDQHDNVEMDLAQLRTGSISYSPATGDVIFKMEVTGKNNEKVASESVRVLRTRPSPLAPADATPQQAAVPAAAKPEVKTPDINVTASPASNNTPNTANAANAANNTAPPTVNDAPEATKAPERTLKPFQAPTISARLHPANPADLPDAPSLGRVSSVPSAVTGLNMNPSAAPTAPPKPPVPAPPAASAPVEAKKSATGGQLVQAVLVSKKDPEYPKLARETGAKGIVELVATIGTDGRVKAVKIVHGPPMLQKAASDAVLQWKYKPTTLNGVPVEAQTQVFVNFLGGDR